MTHPPDVPDAPLAFVDVETTSLHRDLRRPWEIAVISRPAARMDDPLTVFVADVDLSDADDYALKIGRFWERHPLHAPAGTYDKSAAMIGDLLRYAAGPHDPVDGMVTVRHVASGQRFVVATEHVATRILWQRLYAPPGGPAVHLVASNPAFDADVLEQMMRRHNARSCWSYHLVNVADLAIGYLAATGRPVHPPYASPALADALGVPPVPDERRHTATGDAEWVRDLYDRIQHPRPTAVQESQ